MFTKKETFIKKLNNVNYLNNQNNYQHAFQQ